MTGNLAYAGIEGVVYSPAEGEGLPAVAFGHDWLKAPKAYHATLRHLASWGIVVGAPATERGFNPDHSGFAADLDSTLQILSGVRLGEGNVTVNPGRLGVVGHGMGAGTAVLASASNDRVMAVAAILPAPVSPSSYAAAEHVTAPGLIIASSKGGLFGAGDPPRLAQAWGADVALREVDGINQQSFSEDTLAKLAIGFGLPQHAGQERVRGLVTGFLLHQLTGDKDYAGFSEPDATAKKVTSVVGEELTKRLNNALV